MFITYNANTNELDVKYSHNNNHCEFSEFADFVDAVVYNNINSSFELVDVESFIEELERDISFCWDFKQSEIVDKIYILVKLVKDAEKLSA